MTPEVSRVPAPLWRRLLPPLLAALLTAVFAATLLSPTRNATTGGPLIGKPAPPFALRDLDGSTVRLERFRGRPVVINFWASWCTPCRQEAPLFRELSDQQATSGGLAMIGILFQETSDSNARNFLREFALTYPTLRDPGARTAIDYGVSGIPETVFIDRQGVVQYLDRGALTRERLNAGLKSIGVAGP